MQDIDRYTEEWTRMMLTIWREAIERLRVMRTGRLHESFTSAISDAAEGKTIEMKFVNYGIYQALGTGYGYSNRAGGNAGSLEFLDPGYRREHRLDRPRKVGPAWGGGMTSGHPRKRRDWLSKKLYMSLMAMKEDLARITGEVCVQEIKQALLDARNAANK